MKKNFFLFCIAFVVISFFITLNLFFERAFQNEIIQLTNRQLGLLVHNLSESLSFALNNAYNYSYYLSVKTSFKKDELNPVLKDLEKKLGFRFLNISYKDLKKKLKIQEDLSSSKVFLDEIERKLYFVFPFKERNKGYLISEISLDILSHTYLKPVRVGKKGYTWLIAKDGTLLFHPTQPQMVGKNIFKIDKTCLACHKSFEAEKNILTEDIETGYRIYISPEKEDKLISYSKLNVFGYEWFLCFSIPYSEVVASMDKSLKLHSLIIIFIFLFMIIFSLSFYYTNLKKVRMEESLKYLEEQKRLINKLEETKTYLEHILESTQIKIVVLNKEYKLTLVNSSYANLLKKKKEELIGHNFFEVCPQSIDYYKELLKKLIEEAFEGKSGYIRNYPLQENGKIKYFYIIISPLIFEDKVIGAVLTCDDITNEIELRETIKNYAENLEKLVEKRTQELQYEKEKLSIIMESINSGICLINDKGDILWMNKKMQEYLKEKEKLNICVIFNRIGDCLIPDRSNYFIEKLRINGKEHFFQVQITPFKDQSGAVNYIALIQDITDMKLMEERLAQSEKLTSLARISAGLAHEIGNPLTSISSYVQILKEMDLGEFGNEALDIISKHILRISEIIRNISNFAKPSKGELMPTDVREVLDSSLGLVKFDKRMKNIKVEIKFEEIPKVLVDPHQLNQVFINIILNAADAMPEGGTLTIETKRLNQEMVEISFTDTGIGIPSENMPYIFDPFFTTKEKGTGFGLSVSYSIIKNFGGDILVESEVGKGSTFRIRLPVFKGIKVWEMKKS